jgi:hypothetical protein
MNPTDDRAQAEMLAEADRLETLARTHCLPVDIAEDYLAMATRYRRLAVSAMRHRGLLQALNPAGR